MEDILRLVPLSLALIALGWWLCDCRNGRYRRRRQGQRMEAEREAFRLTRESQSRALYGPPDHWGNRLRVAMGANALSDEEIERSLCIPPRDNEPEPGEPPTME